jgi:hypothetical protein
MLKTADFHLANVQLVAFTPDLSAFSTPKSLAAVLGRFSDVYDGNVQTFPLPDDAPPDIPRVILQSKDESRRLDISLARISLNSIKIGEKLVRLEDNVNESVEILNHYTSDLGARVNRLGLVVIRTHQSDLPTKLIIEKFYKPELKSTVFRDTVSLIFRNHQTIKIDDLNANLITTFSAGSIQINNAGVQGIVVEQDINTVVEEISQHFFSIEEIKTYFQSALKEIEDNFNSNLSKES